MSESLSAHAASGRRRMRADTLDACKRPQATSHLREKRQRSPSLVTRDLGKDRVWIESRVLRKRVTRRLRRVSWKIGGPSPPAPPQKRSRWCLRPRSRAPEWSPRVFDEFPRFYETSETFAYPNRLNLRHEAIFGENKEVFEGQRVLDIASHDGRWSFAALKAGATSVVGIEGRPSSSNPRTRRSSTTTSVPSATGSSPTTSTTPDPETRRVRRRAVSGISLPHAPLQRAHDRDPAVQPEIPDHRYRGGR